MQRYGFERGLLVEDSEHGQWVRYSDLAAARAENERLTQGMIKLATELNKAADAQIRAAEAERDSQEADFAKSIAIEVAARLKAEAERDEARAQVQHMEGFDRCTCGPCAIHGTAERDQAVAAAYEAAAVAVSEEWTKVQPWRTTHGMNGTETCATIRALTPADANYSSV